MIATVFWLLRILRLYRYASVLHDQFSTFNTNVYDFDPIDNGKLVSAGTMKAKLKLSDEVLVALCQGERARR